MSDWEFCDQPDRHEPKLKCGYPLPCPHHTLVVEEIAPGVVSVGRVDGEVLTEVDIEVGLRRAARAAARAAKKSRKSRR